MLGAYAGIGVALPSDGVFRRHTTEEIRP